MKIQEICLKKQKLLAITLKKEKKINRKKIVKQIKE
jgi:hypothetical protein